MLEKIREYWLDRAFKKNQRKHGFLNIADMQTVIIIFDIVDRMEIILLAEDLSKMGKTTILVTANDNKHLDEVNYTKKVHVLKKEDYSKFFILKKKAIEEFSNVQYDALIDTRRTNTNMELEYLLAINKSKCCVGFRTHKYKAFDICIIGQKNKNILETYEQMKYYLSKF